MIKQDILNKIEVLKDKLIHISCIGGRFYNGSLLEINKEKGFIILIDRKIGEVPIMFEEIKFIEPYKERS